MWGRGAYNFKQPDPEQKSSPLPKTQKTLEDPTPIMITATTFNIKNAVAFHLEIMNIDNLIKTTAKKNNRMYNTSIDIDPLGEIKFENFGRKIELHAKYSRS